MSIILLLLLYSWFLPNRTLLKSSSNISMRPFPRSKCWCQKTTWMVHIELNLLPHGTTPKSTTVGALNTCQRSCFAAVGPGCAKFGVNSVPAASKCGMWDAIFWDVQLFGWFWQLRHLNGHGTLTMASKSPFANRRYCSSLRVSWGFLRFLLFEMEPGSLAKITIFYLNNDFYPVLKHAVLFSFKSTWFSKNAHGITSK